MNLQITEVILLLMLAAAAMQDTRTGTINILTAAAGAALCIGAKIFTGVFQAEDTLLGAGVGIAMLLIGYASRQALGYGDGVLLTATGCALGAADNFVLLLLSLVLSGIVSIIFMVMKKRRGCDRIAFAPFVLG